MNSNEHTQLWWVWVAAKQTMSELVLYMHNLVSNSRDASMDGQYQRLCHLGYSMKTWNDCVLEIVMTGEQRKSDIRLHDC